MENMLGGGGGGGGGQGQFPLEQWFYEMPICTRLWTVATVATSILVQCHIITPFQLFYSFRAVFLKSQVRSSPCPFFRPPSVSLPNNPSPLHPNDHRTYFSYLMLTRKGKTVLAHPDPLPLLRSTKPRPPLPRLLPATLLAPARRILGSFPGALRLAAAVRQQRPAPHVAAILHALPRLRPQQHPRLHLEPAQSRHATESPRPDGLHRPVSAVGLDGLFARFAWLGAERRDGWRLCRAWYVLEPPCRSSFLGLQLPFSTPSPCVTYVISDQRGLK